MAKSLSSEITFTHAKETERACAPCATAAPSMSTAIAPYASPNLAFCSGPATCAELTTTPWPSPVSVELPSRPSITFRGVITSPTFKPGLIAPANPTDRIEAGRYSTIAASAARLPASAPMPLQMSTAFSCSKTLKRRPSYSCSTLRQFFTSGLISCSRAATSATDFLLLDILSSRNGTPAGGSPSSTAGVPSYIAIGSKPLHRATQCVIHGSCLPPQLALCLRRTHKHLFPAHANRVHGRARLSTENPSVDDFIHSTGCQSHYVRNSYPGRRQAGDRGELVKNLLEREVFSAQDIALSASPFLPCRHVPLGALPDIHQVQSRIHVGRKLLLQEIDNDSAGRRRFDVALPDWGGWIHHHHFSSLPGRRFPPLPQGEFFGHELRTFVVADHLLERHWRILIRRRATAGEPHRRHARRVHHTPHAVSLRSFQQPTGAVHIGSVHLLRIANPQPVIGRDVEN